MTVTVIIIIAVIIVLAVLVLLLLGMRALSLGSREDDYDDDHEYDEIDLDDHEYDEPRGRSRRPRQGGGNAERRSKKRRGVDWEDDLDELSDNDFWSSLSQEGPAQRRSNPYNRTHDDLVDDYDDHEGPQYEEEDDDRAAPPGVPSPLSSSGSGMAALADLGQESGPQHPYRAEPPGESDQHSLDSFDQHALPSQPEPSALPPTQGMPQGLPPTQPVTGSAYQNSPLGSPSWPSDDPLSAPSGRDRAPLGGDSPSGVGATWRNDPFDASGGSYGATDDPLGGPYPPAQNSSVDGPLLGVRSSHESGTHSRHPGPYQGGPTPSYPNPLDPDFRPSAPAGDSGTSSPIWSSMDTGAHQRPDPSVLRGPLPESSITDPGAGYGGSTPHEYPASSTPSSYGQGAPGGDPLSGGYPSMAHSDQGFDSGYFQGSPYDSGTHNRPTYDTDPYGLSSPTPSNPGPPPQNPPSPYGDEMHGGFARTGPTHPMGGSHPGDARGHPPMPPSGGYPADRLREEPRPYGEQLPGPYKIGRAHV